MTMTPARRKANQKWDKAHYKAVACKIPIVKAEAFRAACQEDGTTPNAILTAAIDTYMQERGGWDAWTAPANTDAAAGETTGTT